MWLISHLFVHKHLDRMNKDVEGEENYSLIQLPVTWKNLPGSAHPNPSPEAAGARTQEDAGC